MLEIKNIAMISINEVSTSAHDSVYDKRGQCIIVSSSPDESVCLLFQPRVSSSPDENICLLFQPRVSTIPYESVCLECLLLLMKVSAY